MTCLLSLPFRLRDIIPGIPYRPAVMASSVVPVLATMLHWSDWRGSAPGVGDHVAQDAGNQEAVSSFITTSLWERWEESTPLRSRILVTKMAR